MEFILSNEPFEKQGLGQLKYISNYKVLQKDLPQYSHYRELIDLMVRTNLKSKFNKSVCLVTDKFGASLMFDHEFFLHINSMIPDLLHFGTEVQNHETVNSVLAGTFFPDEIDSVEENDDDDDVILEKRFFTPNVYKSSLLYKCRLDMPRNRFVTIAYRILEHEGVPDLYCQWFYSGANLFSRSLMTKLTFKLRDFLSFIALHGKTLYLYGNARAVVNKRYGRNTYILRRPQKEEVYKPLNHNRIFLDDHEVTTTDMNDEQFYSKL